MEAVLEVNSWSTFTGGEGLQENLLAVVDTEGLLERVMSELRLTGTGPGLLWRQHCWWRDRWINEVGSWWWCVIVFQRRLLDWCKRFTAGGTETKEGTGIKANATFGAQVLVASGAASRGTAVTTSAPDSLACVSLVSAPAKILPWTIPHVDRCCALPQQNLPLWFVCPSQWRALYQKKVKCTSFVKHSQVGWWPFRVTCISDFSLTITKRYISKTEGKTRMIMFLQRPADRPIFFE